MKHFIGFDKLVAILTIPIAVWLIIVEYKTPRPSFLQQVGPHVWPIGILGIIIVFAVALYFRAIHEARQQAPPPAAAVPSSTQAAMKWYERPRAVAVLFVVGLLLYASFLNFLGFILATFLLVIYQARLLERGRWIRNVSIAAVFSVGVYYVFVKVLEASLPAGLLGW